MPAPFFRDEIIGLSADSLEEAACSNLENPYQFFSLFLFSSLYLPFSAPLHNISYKGCTSFPAESLESLKVSWRWDSRVDRSCRLSRWGRASVAPPPPFGRVSRCPGLKQEHKLTVLCVLPCVGSPPRNPIHERLRKRLDENE